MALSLAIVGTAEAADSSSGAPQVYRWVDDKGVVHYGDSVPIEYAQSDRSVLNKQGVEVGHIEGGKSPAEEAARAAAAEQAQQRSQHDQFLLSTYVSSKDIEQLRDERLGQMDAQIKAAMAYIDTLNAGLNALAERAMGFKPYSTESSARRMPDDLAEDLVHTINELRSQHRALEVKQHEQVDAREQFEVDIRRYRELTARPHT